jgi:uncharacterized protein YjbJ (UPF0337 family)
MTNWNETKTKLKQKFIQLTDKDLFLVKGKHEELLCRLEAKLGKSRESLRKIISEL